jgi:hypothetical protein
MIIPHNELLLFFLLFIYINLDNEVNKLVKIISWLFLLLIIIGLTIKK